MLITARPALQFVLDRAFDLRLYYFLVHFDLARYMLPAVLFTLILPFASWVERHELRPVWLITCVLAYFFTFIYWTVPR